MHRRIKLLLLRTVNMIAMQNKIRLQFHILKRAVKLATRKSKSIRLLHFSHVHSSDSGEILIKLKFSNALYLLLDGQMLLHGNLRVNAADGTFDLIIQGLFKRKDYTLDISGGDVVLTRTIFSRRNNTPKHIKPSASVVINKEQGIKSPEYSVA